MVIRAQHLTAHGLTRAEIRARVRRGEAHQVRPGAWSLSAPSTPEEHHLELIAATWPALREGAVLSHASAAVLHGLPMPARELARVHVTRPGDGGGKRARFLHVHRSIDLGPDVVRVGDLPVTSLERTVVDLARLLPGMDALAAVDRALALGLDRGSALTRVEPRVRRPGTARARAVLHHGDPLAESPGESWSRWRMIELGIPLPRLQVPLLDRSGTEVARPDFTWEEQGLVGEFDGAIKYGRLVPPGQQVTDVVLAEKAREERIRRAGYWVVRWTAADLFPAERFRRLLAEAWANGRRAA